MSNDIPIFDDFAIDFIECDYESDDVLSVTPRKDTEGVDYLQIQIDHPSDVFDVHLVVQNTVGLDRAKAVRLRDAIDRYLAQRPGPQQVEPVATDGLGDIGSASAAS